MEVSLPSQGPPLTDRFDPRTLWWRHERLHRAALLGNFGKFAEEIRSERDELEAEFRIRIKAVMNGGSALEKSHAVAQCWKTANEMEDGWHARLMSKPEFKSTPHADAWKKMNTLAGIDPFVATHSAEYEYQIS